MTCATQRALPTGREVDLGADRREALADLQASILVSKAYLRIGPCHVVLCRQNSEVLRARAVLHRAAGASNCLRSSARLSSKCLLTVRLGSGRLRQRTSPAIGHLSTRKLHQVSVTALPYQYHTGSLCGRRVVVPALHGTRLLLDDLKKIIDTPTTLEGLKEDLT